MKPLADQYAEACLPERWTVAGVPLAPFSIGHWQILTRFGSPLVGRAESVGFPDLAFALFVCSRNASRFAGIGRLPLRWRWWARVMSIRFKRNPVDLRGCIGLFLLYVEDAAQEIATWQKPGPPGAASMSKSARPKMLELRRVLMSHYGYRDREVTDMPLGRALWEFTAWAEADGHCWLRSPEDDIRREQLDKDLAELEKVNGRSPTTN